MFLLLEVKTEVQSLHAKMKYLMQLEIELKYFSINMRHNVESLNYIYSGTG